MFFNFPLHVLFRLAFEFMNSVLWLYYFSVYYWKIQLGYVQVPLPTMDYILVYTHYMQQIYEYNEHTESIG
jgi:hypothetical protein